LARTFSPCDRAKDLCRKSVERWPVQRRWGEQSEDAATLGVARWKFAMSGLDIGPVCTDVGTHLVIFPVEADELRFCDHGSHTGLPTRKSENSLTVLSIPLPTAMAYTKTSFLLDEGLYSLARSGLGD
jgi:hypothetical protein